MASRFYFGLAAPVVSPTFDGSWEVTTSAVRRNLEAYKAGSTFETIALSTNANSPAGAVDRLLAQYVSAPLDVDQTITGTVKGQIKALEDNTAGDLRAQVLIWVRKSDGTSRGTLLAHDTGALSSEFPTGTRTNRQFPRGGAISLSSVAALATDRIVVEIGYRKHENATNTRTGDLVLGNFDITGSDLAEDETATGSDTPWIEFSQSLTFSLDARATQVAAEVLVLPDAPVARATQVAAEVLVLPDTPVARVTQVAIEVLRRTNPEGGSQIIVVGM